MKNKITSATAVISLGVALGVGAWTLRAIKSVQPHRVLLTEPPRLTSITYEAPASDTSSYALFRRMRNVAKEAAGLITVSYADATQLTGAGGAGEEARIQHVSGCLFRSLGVRLVLGQSGNDGAILSYSYWNRRFPRNAKIIGAKFHLNGKVFQIIGVAAPGCTGIEPGASTDIFLPATNAEPPLGTVATLIRATRLNPSSALRPE